VKHFIWVRWALVACVLLGLSVPWLYLTLLNNKDIVRSILSQIPTGPYLIDAYHHFVPTPREVNDIPYSIFSLKPAWEIENQAVRDALPDFSVIRGLNLDKFPSTSIPSSTRFNTWERSNADAFSSKYSELNQINVSNVKHLVPAWTYHSGEQLLNAKIWATNVETNPIIADRKIFVTTPADFWSHLMQSTGRRFGGRNFIDQQDGGCCGGVETRFVLPDYLYLLQTTAFMPLILKMAES